jgi:protocatechuate 3,4-dioxygenase beta subunit
VQIASDAAGVVDPSMVRAIQIGAFRRLAIALGLAAGAVLLLRRAPDFDGARAPGSGEATAVTADSHPESATAANLEAKRELAVEGSSDAAAATTASTTLDYVAHAATFGVALTPWPEFECRVVHDEDGTPVAGAAVEVTCFDPSMSVAPGDTSIEELRGAAALRGTTDASGRFRVRTGAGILVTVGAPGFGIEAKAIEKPATDAAAVPPFKLRRSLTFGGRVLDADGTPVSGARVHAIGLQKTGGHRFWRCSCGNPYVEWRFDLGKTGDDGRFDAVDCYAAGRIALAVSVDGRAIVFPTLALDRFDVPSRSVELRLPPSCILEGVVRRVDGTPAADMRVVAVRQFDAWSALESEEGCDDEGGYRIALEAPGLYRVRLVDPNGPGGRIEIVASDADCPAGVTRLDLVDPRPAPRARSADGDGSDDSEEKPANGSVGGELRGRSAADRTVSGHLLLIRSGRVVQEVETDDDGNFAFEDVEPGTCSVSALVPGFRRFDGAPFVVASGRRTDLPAIALEAYGAIRGRVFDSDGRGVAGADVRLEVRVERADDPWRGPYDEVANTQSDAAGAFSLPALDVAARLEVDVAGLAPVVVPLAVVFPATAPEVVVAVGARRTVGGRIVTAGGLPDARLTVACWSVVDPERRDEFDGMLDPVEKVSEVEVARDGTFSGLVIPAAACDLELWFNTSSWDSVGMTVARRHLPSGAADLDLGDWNLPSPVR